MKPITIIKSLLAFGLVLSLLTCSEQEKTNITGTIEVGSITPAPGSPLPPLGDKLTFTFTDIKWSTENKKDDEEMTIAVWFFESKDEKAKGKFGWMIGKTKDASGTQTITEEMTSWNHSTFSKLPTTLSVGLCKSSDVIKGVLSSCDEIAVTKTYNYTESDNSNNNASSETTDGDSNNNDNNSTEVENDNTSSSRGM